MHWPHICAHGGAGRLGRRFPAWGPSSEAGKGSAQAEVYPLHPVYPIYPLHLSIKGGTRGSVNPLHPVYPCLSMSSIASWSIASSSIPKPLAEIQGGVLNCLGFEVGIQRVLESGRESPGRRGMAARLPTRLSRFRVHWPSVILPGVPALLEASHRPRRLG